MTDLDKARGWAEDGKGLYNPGSRTKAVIDVILSLPDQWVDAEKLERIIAGMDCCLTQGSETNFSDGFKEATTTWRDALKALIPPKLPTLADMTEEERAACQWMQARLEGSAFDFVISDPGIVESMLWAKGGTAHIADNSLITPLPGPKLKWPAQEPRNPETPPAETLNNTSSDTPRNPRPEDVPAGEPWIVEYDGIRHVGAREKGAVTYLDWALARLDGTECIAARDAEITLVSRLVPESHTLPEGMRLADHETLGRIVVSQRADEDGDYAFFESTPGGIAGASWGYVNKSELTFLDGGN